MTKLNIPRLPGESKEDFKRRYGREQMRAYRAAHPPPKKGYRDPETGPRKNSPFTQEEWDALRRREDETEREWINRNAAARHAKFMERHPGKRAAQSRAKYATNPSPERERSRRYREDNPEKVRAGQDRYCETHKEERLERNRRWIKANPEKRRAIVKRWHAANPGLNAHYSARWRRECRQATPAWADLSIIRRFYEEARRISESTGVPHEVDHIVPIQGRTVRGLHVHTNLRILRASLNSHKRNKFHPELLELFDALVIW